MVQSSGRLQQGGRLVVSKEDFNAHYQGEAFRHDGTMIDMNPTIPNVGGTTVQACLENLNSIIVSGGSGFISIGSADGYDGYASGSYNVGTEATPTFVDAFNAAQDDARLTNGGVILILAGSYSVTSAITVRPGITVIGEIGGTYLIGETNEQSMFIVSSVTKSLNIGGNSGSGAVDITSSSNVDKVKFQNLIFFDNLDGYIASGDSSMVTVPMISLQQGGNLECENVSFFGRLNAGSITNRSKTYAAVGTVSGSAIGTSLTMQHCFFDGVKNGVYFNPQVGASDFLTITHCKARFYGKEAVSYTAGEDAFITASLCQTQVCHNYVVGGHANAKNLLHFKTTGGTTSTIRVVVTGNYGQVTTSNALLIDNDSGVTFNGAIANNSWGIHAGNPWFITVGGTDGDSPLGDIFGPNAINTIISWANSISLEAMVVINPGTYTVTASATATSNVANLRLIGNKRGRNYPILQLNISSTSTDALGNRFLVLGNHLESLYFTSINRFQSIRPSFNPLGISSQNPAQVITVKDCVFYDTALNILDINTTPTDQSGNATSTMIQVENCHFDQSGTFNDNMSAIIPTADIVNIKNCYFDGWGYAFSIGQEAYGTTSGIYGQYILENVIVNRSDGIDNNMAGTVPSDKCCTIMDATAKVLMKNCSLYTSRNNASTTGIEASLVDDGIFLSFVHIEAIEIELENCYFNGPNQAYTTGGTIYALPCVKLVPSDSLHINNCRFHSGGLPLQVQSTFPNNHRANQFTITNSSFRGTTNATNTTITLLDVDLSKGVDAFTNPVVLNISNCAFLHTNSMAAGYQVQHVNNTGAEHNAHGIVQLYCTGLDVKFTDNKLWGPLFTPLVNPYTHVAGVVVYTGSEDWPTSAHLSNNNIQIHGNNHSVASASVTASCAFISTKYTNLNHNFLEFENDVAASTSFAGCLVLNIRSGGDGLVSDNHFSNKDYDGAVSVLARGFVTILSTTGSRGRITNNSFSATTYNGSSTDLVEDNTSAANNWLVAYNKNQTGSLSIHGSYGQIGIRDGAETYYAASGIIPSVTASNAGYYLNSSNSVIFDYQDTGNSETFSWDIPVYSLLPHGVYISNISLPIDVSATPSVTSTATIKYRDTSGDSTDTSNPLTITGDTLLISLSANTRVNLPELKPEIEFTWQVSSASPATLTAEPMTITYVW